eukprot:6491891-Amphidinium_carterae.2
MKCYESFHRADILYVMRPNGSRMANIGRIRRSVHAGWLKVETLAASTWDEWNGLTEAYTRIAIDCDVWNGLLQAGNIVLIIA